MLRDSFFMQELSIIFPCYNEADRLPRLFEVLEKFSIKDWSLHYVFVDDASSDSSLELIKTFKKLHSQLSVEIVAKKVNEGKGPAVQSGDAVATTNLRCFLDADLSTPMETIPDALIRFEDEKASLLIGSRHCPGAKLNEPQGALRYFLGRAFSFFTSIFHHSAFTDTQCGFKIWNKKFSDDIVQNSKPSRWSFDIEWIMRAEQQQLAISEHPVVWTNDGRSKVSAVGDGFRMACDVVKYRLVYGSRILLVLNVVFFVMGLSMAVRSSNDLLIYWNKAWIPMSHGVSQIYEPLRASQGGYYYSPLFALLGVPLAWLSESQLKISYYLIYVFLLIASWALLRRLMRYAGVKNRNPGIVYVILVFSLLNNHFGQALSGNVSAQIFSLMVFSGYAYFQGSKSFSAAMMALAINFKIYPAFMLLFFLLKKDFKFLIACAGFYLLYLLAPTLWVGWDQNIQMHLDQIATVKAFGPQSDFGRIALQSVAAAFVRAARFLGFNDALGMRAAQIIGTVAVVVFFLKIAGKKMLLGNAFFLWGFTLLVLGLIAPASWVHHFGFVYAPVIYTVLAVLFGDKTGLKRILSSQAGGSFFVFFLLYCLSTDAIIGTRLNDVLELWSVPVLGLLFLGYAFVRVSRSVLATTE